MDEKQGASGASWVNVLAGIWLIISPFALNYLHTNSANNDFVAGAIITVLALVRAFSPLRNTWLSVINALAGLWLVIAPFALGYTMQQAYWSDIVTGIVVIVIAVASSSITYNRTHNWA